MGYIDDVMGVINEINYASIYNNKGLRKLTNKIARSINVRKLKKHINKIKEDELPTKMIFEYANYYLDKFDIHNDTNHIKQVLKGENGEAGSITFKFDMPDHYTATVTVNFTNKSYTMADYLFIILGPNSSMQLTVTEHNIAIYQAQITDDHYLATIGKSGAEKVEQLRYIMVTEITKEIKDFLLSSIEVKEVVNGEPGGQ